MDDWDREGGAEVESDDEEGALASGGVRLPRQPLGGEASVLRLAQTNA